jgi:16S rRNA (guanine(1405)-N(7))-methyltransferase
LNGSWLKYRYINDEPYIHDAGPISEYCDCPCCKYYSAGYLHHLFKMGDSLYMRLATLHICVSCLNFATDSKEGAVKVDSSEQLDELIRLVQASDKYAHIDSSLIKEIGRGELAKRASLKEAVKATRNKLHQVGSSYQEIAIPYASWIKLLANLPHSLSDPEVMQFLAGNRRMHASTSERSFIEEKFFQESLAPFAPVESILDLACGLNPLNYRFMPLAEHCEYFACDIYQDMVNYLNQFFAHFEINGKAEVCDLAHQIPSQKVQVALLLKTIPCLEQIDKNAGLRLLEGLNAEVIVVSFPSRSLGGKSKGMAQNYEAHFNQLIAGKSWQVTKIEFPGELTFMVRK